ncbi:MAG: glycogen debranching enzyme family protein [Armatimonadetes bacterium]|nr:glycogen debranching enzyme family protein [Armatimonadota bacterium]
MYRVLQEMVRMTLDEGVLHNLGRALNLEWLDTNGLGGFACSTVIGCNTRRYHGLLIAAPDGPSTRQVLLGKLEERLDTPNGALELSSNIYGDVMNPLGYRYLRSFTTTPWPTWTFAGEDWELRRELALLYGHNTLVVRYTLVRAPHPVWLVVRPLLAGRDYHHLRRAASDVPWQITIAQRSVDLQISGPDTRCLLQFPDGEFLPDGLWYYDFRYPREEERGLDAREDLYSPGVVRWLMSQGQTCHLVAAAEEEIPEPEAALASEKARREAVPQALPATDSMGRRLVLAADQFVARRRLGERWLTTIVAGYPWFTDWGRDTMIALPGLLLATGRLEEAGEVLELFASAMRGGLVPNRFADDGSGASYNAVDATLWLFVAARLYANERLDFVLDRLYRPLAEALGHLREGTDFSIGVDEDGLLVAGDPTTQLTWMDATVHGQPVTPRWHKPVEVESLWFSALRGMEYLAKKAGDTETAKSCAALARQVKAAFLQTFWDAQRGYLADCALPDGLDESLRPNQVIALSLPYKIVEDEIAGRCLDVVEEHLLTPYGLRTLAPGAPGYAPVYTGGPDQRDAAYHQGTVWPWLIGPYVRARMKLLGTSEVTRRWARDLLQPLIAHLDDACLGQISEIFDAEQPQQPRGCFAQAWSVAEVLRLWIEYKLAEA